MKKLLLIFLAIPILCNAAPQKKMDVYFGNVKINSYTVEQFTALVNSAELHVMLVEAENKGNLYVVLSDTEYTFIDNVYKGFITIVWESNHKILKEIKISVVLNLTQTEPTFLQKIESVYQKLAAWGFPVAAIILIIAIL